MFAPLPAAVTLAGYARPIRVDHMRSSWIRAWIATAAVAIAAVTIARTRVGWLLKVEEPVMDWVLDGTDAGAWDRAGFLSSPWLLIVGTLILIGVGLWIEWRVAAAIVITTVIGTILAQLMRGLVGRTPPDASTGTSSFPSVEIVQTGVFFGLVVLMLWWLGAPRLVWQIAVEAAIVFTLLVSIRLILNGEIWPSDAVGSAIVIALSLITAALVFEANPGVLPWRQNRNPVEPVAG